MIIDGQTLVAGNETVQGNLCKLDAPLSFWGGFDPHTGRIIDQSHPKAGALLAGRVVAMPGSRGSSGTPGVLGESLRRGTGPIGLLLTKADINLAAGVIAAAALYEITCPLILIDEATFAALVDGMTVTLPCC